MKNYMDGDCRQSDILPDGDVNSASSAENEQNFEVFEEKFRVDRKKLELMLQGSNENKETAEHFFQRVMNETCTVITWPSKLKIGAKSKKDPHVKIRGYPLAIKEARTQIKAALDTKTNQVTLKMDVSYCDHSHVIGKAGKTHKTLSSATECLIHFPDSNRNSMTEKNNQVSISGSLGGVERARESIRELMPVVFNFEIPHNNGALRLERTAHLQSFQQTYDVQVQFKQSIKMDMCTTVAVRGSEWNLPKLKTAVAFLKNELIIRDTIYVPVFMTIEISPRHLGEVEEICRELKIVQQTRTRITFPDVNTMGPATSKMTVTITGDIDGVYTARKLLLGCLPLILLFDLNEDQKIDKDYVVHVKEQYGIFITIKEKPKLNCVQVIVKGRERNAKNMYSVRQNLLGLGEIRDHSLHDINWTFHLTNAVASSTDLYRNANLSNLGFQSLNLNTRNLGVVPSPLSSANPPLRPMPGISTGGWNTSSTFPVCYQMPASTSVPDEFSNLLSRLSGSVSVPESEGGYYSAPSGTNSRLTSPALSPSPSSSEDSIVSSLYSGLPFSSGWSSSSSVSNEKLSNLFSQLSQKSIASNDVGLSTCVENVEMIASNGLTLDDKLPESQSNEFKPVINSTDYARKKRLASKAMKNKPLEAEVRIPTSSWSGYGFSNSFPDGVIREQRLHRSLAFEQNGSPPIEESVSVGDKNPWNSASHKMLITGMKLIPDDRLTTSNYTESFSHHARASSVINCNSLSEFLAHIGLEKYTRIFEQQDVDFETFLTLTDMELQSLGITTFGALRKMRQALTTFKKEQSAFSPAPGAERKMSSNLSKSLSVRSKD